MSTPVPVTDGSGILCWVGEGDDLEASQCFHNQNMCGYLLVSNTSVISASRSCKYDLYLFAD